MSIVDLHPEELLDKHSGGTISEAELARLEGHMATCTVCRLEIALRFDFEELAAEPLGTTHVERPSAPEFAAAPIQLAASGPRPFRRSRRRAWIVGLAAALIGGMSFAALSAGIIPSAWKPAPPARDRVEHGNVSFAKDVTVPPGATVTSNDAPANSGTPAVAVRADLAEVHGDTHPAVFRAPHATQTAPELFRAANAARRVDQDRAIALYRELESRYPRSEEARVSYATLGSLLLDRGDPRSALEGFNSYLSRGGAALGEEALVGRAIASQKLGDRDVEIATWQEILHRFPASVHARRARARLSDLGER